MRSDKVSDPVRLGVAGLGRGFMLTLPSLKVDERVRLVAACARQKAQRARFEKEFSARSYETLEALCADEAVEAVYIATPHELHKEHVEIAAKAGKHILVEKPIAISLEDGLDIIDAVERAGVKLIVGPSHSFDAPILQAREMIESGAYGAVRMIHAFNYTEFLYRPRRPEELDTSQGGGVVFSQGVHQIDIVRLLAGGEGRDVYAQTGAWDKARPTEGAYTAIMRFQNGVIAHLTYSGYAHFDSDEWQEGIGELGQIKSAENYGKARKALLGAKTPAEEAAMKAGRTYGEVKPSPPAPHHEHFGPVIVSLDKADLRISPEGVWVYGHYEKTFLPAPKLAAPRMTVIEALYKAIRHDAPPPQDARWGVASLEVCHAILASAARGAPVVLKHQVGIGAKPKAPAFTTSGE